MPKMFHAINRDQTISFFIEEDRATFFKLSPGQIPPDSEDVVFCDSDVSQADYDRFVAWQREDVDQNFPVAERNAQARTEAEAEGISLRAYTGPERRRGPLHGGWSETREKSPR